MIGRSGAPTLVSGELLLGSLAGQLAVIPTILICGTAGSENRCTHKHCQMTMLPRGTSFSAAAAHLQILRGVYFAAYAVGTALARKR